jgi:hypothetical protein
VCPHSKRSARKHRDSLPRHALSITAGKAGRAKAGTAFRAARWSARQAGGQAGFSARTVIGAGAGGDDVAAVPDAGLAGGRVRDGRPPRPISRASRTRSVSSVGLDPRPGQGGGEGLASAQAGDQAFSDRGAAVARSWPAAHRQAAARWDGGDVAAQPDDAEDVAVTVGGTVTLVGARSGAAPASARRARARASGDRHWRDRRARSRPGRSARRADRRGLAQQGRSRKTPRPSGQTGDGDQSRGIGDRGALGPHGGGLGQVVGGVAQQQTTLLPGRAGGVGEQAGGGRRGRRRAGRWRACRPPRPGLIGRRRPEPAVAASAAGPGGAVGLQAVVDGQAQHPAAVRPRPVEGDQGSRARESPPPETPTAIGAGEARIKPAVEGGLDSGRSGRALGLRSRVAARATLHGRRRPWDSAWAVRPGSGRRRRASSAPAGARQLDQWRRAPRRSAASRARRPDSCRRRRHGPGGRTGSCPASSGPRGPWRLSGKRSHSRRSRPRRRRSRRQEQARACW